VKESRRLRTCRLVLSRTVAVQGLHHHQQCNFPFRGSPRGMPQFPLFFYGFMNGIPCEVSARSRKAESDQAHYWVNGCVIVFVAHGADAEKRRNGGGSEVRRGWWTTTPL
ncbi:hypothetical protein Taro_055753, partial [Colocasia esculenta]|nr:hypothetical protein [Colocasia esculenta]